MIINMMTVGNAILEMRRVVVVVATQSSFLATFFSFFLMRMRFSHHHHHPSDQLGLLISGSPTEAAPQSPSVLTRPGRGGVGGLRAARAPAGYKTRYIQTEQ